MQMKAIFLVDYIKKTLRKVEPTQVTGTIVDLLITGCANASTSLKRYTVPLFEKVRTEMAFMGKIVDLFSENLERWSQP